VPHILVDLHSCFVSD
jgi:Ca2+-transporting ATPase